MRMTIMTMTMMRMTMTVRVATLPLGQLHLCPVWPRQARPGCGSVLYFQSIRPSWGWNGDLEKW